MIKRLENLMDVALTLLAGGSLFAIYVLLVAMLFEVFTGYDAIHHSIQPFFQKLLGLK